MLAFHTLDVFTDTAFTGNPLAVVLGADALTTAQMQIIAREFNLSETIFVQAPAQPGHRARVRIFLPGAEIPFAGHPTLGSARAWLVAPADCCLLTDTMVLTVSSIWARPALSPSTTRTTTR